MYEDFLPERLAKLRMQKGVSARDMSLSLGQATISTISKTRNPCPPCRLSSISVSTSV